MMPWASHDLFLNNNLSVTQRGALVRAGIVNGKKIVADPKNSDRTSARLHDDRCARRDFIDLADNVVGHRAPSFSVAPVSFNSRPRRTISPLMSVRNASGVIGSTTQPCSLSRRLRSGALRTLANLACNVRTTPSGRPAGPAKPNQPSR